VAELSKEQIAAFAKQVDDELLKIACPMPPEPLPPSTPCPDCKRIAGGLMIHCAKHMTS
jgi:hypothetical protein